MTLRSSSPKSLWCKVGCAAETLIRRERVAKMVRENLIFIVRQPCTVVSYSWDSVSCSVGFLISGVFDSECLKYLKSPRLTACSLVNLRLRRRALSVRSGRGDSRSWHRQATQNSRQLFNEAEGIRIHWSYDQMIRDDHFCQGNCPCPGRDDLQPEASRA